MEEWYSVAVIGHVTEDLEPKHRVGGGVAYTGATLKGLSPHSYVSTLTKASQGHHCVEELEEIISVVLLPTRKKRRITTFENFEEGDRRLQKVDSLQEKISLKDIERQIIPRSTKIIVSPVIDEVDPEIVREFKEKNYFVAVAAQGYLRKIEKDTGRVIRDRWAEDYWRKLKDADIIFLSDEDITFNDELDEEFLGRLKENVPLLVLTRGSKGLTIYEKEKDPIEVGAFQLEEGEVGEDRVGAGDTVVAAFTWHYLRSKNAGAAGVFAAYVAALKIMGVGGKEGGVKSSPTLEHLQNFAHNSKERVVNYYKENNTPVFSLLFEGNSNYSKEIKG